VVEIYNGDRDSFPMFLPLDTYHDLDRVKFWPLQMSPLLSRFSEHANVGKRSRLEEVKSSSLAPHTYNRSKYLGASIADLQDWREVHASDCQLSSSCIKSRFDSNPGIIM